MALRLTESHGMLLSFRGWLAARTRGGPRRACYHECDMRTIAISIEEASVAAVDRLAQAAGRRRGGGKKGNRSEVIRQAVREFLARRRKQEREERDRQVLSAHRDEIGSQGASLVAEQAEL